MLKSILYIIIAALIFLAGYAKYIELAGVFFPSKDVEYSPDDLRLAFEDVYFKTNDQVDLNGWFIPYKGAKYTVLFLHGNAGNIGHRLDKIGLLRKAEVNIFIIDYRGYGRSKGRPSEKGIYEDARAAYRYLIERRNLSADEIILFGESLGTTAAVDLAAKVKIRALILEGSFSSGQDMARRLYPFLPGFLFKGKFDSLSKIKAIHADKLFIHSKEDEIVPFDLAEKLYQGAGGEKQFIVLSGGHNNAFWDYRQKYSEAIVAFITGL